MDRIPASISDDDLCSGCLSLAYSPGLESVCRFPGGTDAEWPCSFDDDGYVQECKHLSPCVSGQNWTALALEEARWEDGRIVELKTNTFNDKEGKEEISINDVYTARRLVAAWNACRNLSLEALEGGAVDKLLSLLTENAAALESEEGALGTRHAGLIFQTTAHLSIWKTPFHKESK
ncbi:MAG: hypothetical protein KKB70_05800 [Proteobacteria bacterium]|nr:hypothetical protein [Pseudomonadota bacterium]MBU1610251.1 hypothetical protein [Pseudomonadota bacterium]